MAFRTTQALVLSIVDFDCDEIDLAPFILTANLLVTLKCTNSGYSDIQLELIERWLSAHFACIQYPRVTEEQAGPVMEKTQFKVDLALDVTVYGQQAKAIDTAGNLAGMQNFQAIQLAAPKRITWLGTPRSNNW